MDTEQEYATFESKPPSDVAGDPIWRLPAYRMSRFLAIAVRKDCRLIRRWNRRSHVAGQLEEAVDSIGMNITEGYGKLHGKERARYFEHALGSAREAREWYVRTSPPLDPALAAGRTRLLTRIVKILSVAVPDERDGASERRIRAAMERRKKKKEDDDLT